MAGDLKLKYGSGFTLSTTGANNLQASSTLLLGWSTGQIDNTTTLATDYLITGTFPLSTVSSTTIGQILVYAYSAKDFTGGAPVWPTGIFGSGTAGSSGTLTATDAEQRDAGMRLLWSAQEDGSVGDVFEMPATSIAQAFGSVPPYFAIWIVHSSVASFSASNVFMYAQPVLAQYT